MALIVLLDQLSKSFAVNNLPEGVTVKFVDPILNFHYHENSGAAWGILADHPWVFIVLSTVAVVAIIAFFIIYRKKPLPLLLKIGLSFIAGGGIANLIDRYSQHYVVDFLEFGFFDFPIFNVADSFVTVGSALIIVYIIIDTVRDLIRKIKKDAPSDRPDEEREGEGSKETKEETKEEAAEAPGDNAEAENKDHENA